MGQSVTGYLVFGIKIDPNSEEYESEYADVDLLEQIFEKYENTRWQEREEDQIEPIHIGHGFDDNEFKIIGPSYESKYKEYKIETICKPIVEIGSLPESKEEYIESLKAFCKKYGFIYKEPKWFLCWHYG